MKYANNISLHVVYLPISPRVADQQFHPYPSGSLHLGQWIAPDEGSLKDIGKICKAWNHNKIQ